MIQNFRNKLKIKSQNLKKNFLFFLMITVGFFNSTYSSKKIEKESTSQTEAFFKVVMDRDSFLGDPITYSYEYACRIISTIDTKRPIGNLCRINQLESATFRVVGVISSGGIDYYKWITWDVTDFSPYGTPYEACDAIEGSISKEITEYKVHFDNIESEKRYEIVFCIGIFDKNGIFHTEVANPNYFSITPKGEYEALDPYESLSSVDDISSIEVDVRNQIEWRKNAAWDWDGNFYIRLYNEDYTRDSSTIIAYPQVNDPTQQPYSYSAFLNAEQLYDWTLDQIIENGGTPISYFFYYSDVLPQSVDNDCLNFTPINITQEKGLDYDLMYDASKEKNWIWVRIRYDYFNSTGQRTYNENCSRFYIYNSPENP